MPQIDFFITEETDDQDIYNVIIAQVKMDTIPRKGDYIYFFVDDESRGKFNGKDYRPYEVDRVDFNINLIKENVDLDLVPRRLPQTRISVWLVDVLQRKHNTEDV